VVPGWSRRVMPVSRRRQLGVLPRQCPADTDAVVVQMFRRPVRVGRVVHWRKNTRLDNGFMDRRSVWDL